MQAPTGVVLQERATGGGAVLCGPWMVSVSIALPPDHVWVVGGTLEPYHQLGRVHARTLAGLGIASRPVSPGAVARANRRLGCNVPWACFGSLAPWELTDLAGRKLVGMAQRRQRTGVLLVAGTLCHSPDWPLLCDSLGFSGDVQHLERITAHCDALVVTPFSAATFAVHLGRDLAAALLAPGCAS